MFPGFAVKTQDHSSKVVADHCSICVLVSFIRKGWARPGGWGRYYGTRIGLALFLFPPFYLSCHYVSSAVFNDGSSLQAVSGCIAVGGGDAVAAEGLCFFFLFMSHCRQEAKKTSQADALNTELFNNVRSTVIRLRVRWRWEGGASCRETEVYRRPFTWGFTFHGASCIRWRPFGMATAERSQSWEFPHRHTGCPSALTKQQYYQKKKKH